MELDKISISYGDAAVVRELSLTAEDGKITSVVGPNGAGKTTMLHALSGLIQLKSGAISFYGDRIDRMSSDAIVRKGLVHVPEGRKIFPSLTVMENLELGSYQRQARKNMAQNLDYVFGYFPRLRERRGQLAGTLSGGEQQMLAIARGVMAQPKMLILDEPSLGLSPKIVNVVFEKIKRLNEAGVSILLVEQNMVLSLSIADQGYIMEQGRIALAGGGMELLNDPYTKECYLQASG